MGCSGPCVTCGNYLGGCMVAHDEDCYYTASKEELIKRLDACILLDEKDRNLIQTEIDLYEAFDQIHKKADELLKLADFAPLPVDNNYCCTDKRPAKRIRFVLDGCDISFVAEAPEDITLKQLLRQCDRIEPDYCACGIRSISDDEIESQKRWGGLDTEIIIDYNDIHKTKSNVACTIKEQNE